MSDGALRTDVLRALAREGIEVSPLTDSRYRLCKGDLIYVVRMHEVLSNTTAAKIARHFEIPKVRFYPPLKPVIPFGRPKASGEDQ